MNPHAPTAAKFLRDLADHIEANTLFAGAVIFLPPGEELRPEQFVLGSNVLPEKLFWQHCAALVAARAEEVDRAERSNNAFGSYR